MKICVLKRFQEYSFFCSVAPPDSVHSGPLSWKAPSSEEQPGPPLYHATTGSVAGLPCDAKTR